MIGFGDAIVRFKKQHSTYFTIVSQSWSWLLLYVCSCMFSTRRERSHLTLDRAKIL